MPTMTLRRVAFSQSRSGWYLSLLPNNSSSDLWLIESELKGLKSFIRRFN